MRKATVKVYTFSELPEKIQEKIVEKRQQQNGEFFDSKDFVYEDAATIADLFGLDIRIRTVKLMGGGTREDPCIYYSGFWSQGDGACFEGRYEYKKGALKAVKDHAPQDTELHRIVEGLQKIQRANFYQVTAHTKHSGHYYHSGCMQVDVERYDEKELAGRSNDEEEITQLLRDFADWIYNQLEEAYKWETSEEQAREYLENDYTEYTINGDEA